MHHDLCVETNVAPPPPTPTIFYIDSFRLPEISKLKKENSETAILSQLTRLLQGGSCKARDVTEIMILISLVVILVSSSRTAQNTDIWISD